MKPSPGERGTVRRVWVAFCSLIPQPSRLGESGNQAGVSDFQAHWESPFPGLFHGVSFHRLLRCGAPGFMQLASWPER